MAKKKSKKKNHKKSLTRVLTLNSGDKLDEFVIDKLLGAGLSKTAEVHRTNGNEALKLFTLNPTAGFFALRLKKFKAEVDMLSSLAESDHIVNALTEYRKTGKYNGKKMEAHYYVMECMHTSLEKHLIDGLSWSLKSKIGVLEQVVNGLIHSHTKEIFHRDLYTPNVLLNVDGTNITAKICDFGSAKHLGTTAGNYVIPTGHKGYSSPEACVGLLSSTDANRDLLVKGDLYALGLLVYEVVTGTALEQLNVTLVGLATKAGDNGLFDLECESSKKEEFLEKVGVPILERVGVGSILLNDNDGGEPAGKKLDKLITGLLKPKHEERLMDLNMVKTSLAEVKGML